jgi:hypothetical protein
MDSECWFVARHAEAVLLFCNAYAMSSRDFLPWRFRSGCLDSHVCAEMKPVGLPRVDCAALLALPAEVRQKMARLLARMLNEHWLHRSTVVRPEVGNE